MTCGSVLDRAAGFLDGTLGAAECEAVLEHLEGCADCRGLLAALAAAEPGEAGLTDAILARTSGSPCESARSLLCARVDGDLPSADVELVEGHLRHCAACEALVRELHRLREDLPRLAALDPGPGFVAAVLARTSRRPRVASRSAAWAAAVARVFDRPRVALEGAFVAAAVICVPLSGLPDPLAAAPLRAVEQVRGAASEIEATVVVGTRAAWAQAEALVVDGSVAVASRLSQRTAETLRTLRLRHGTISGSRASGEASGGTGTHERSPDAAEETQR